ncbi:MAG TPA: VanW family protein, partial [Oscillospiraceae bacterium]|nr:VanW family protein [Oscillospiraceae bacterium]
MIVAAVLIVAALVTAYLAFSLFVLHGRTILPNTRAAGVDVGGMTVGEAEMALRAALEEPVTVTLRFPDFTSSVTSQEAGVAWDCAAGARRALLYGRESGILGAGFHYLRALTVGGDVEVGFTLADEAAVRAVIAEAAEKIDHPLEQCGWVMTDGGLLLTNGCTGMALDQDALYETVYTRLQSRDETPVDCEPVLRAPEARDWQALWDEVYTEPEDAVFDPETRTVSPSTTGISFDLEAAKTEAAAHGEGESFLVPLTRTEPAVTIEALEALLFRDVLGKCTTYVSGTTNRLSNVTLAASSCNDLLLMPGDEFSYNGVVGSRTTERGYLPAPAYVGNESVDEIGGGICQVSSTIYHTVLLARLQVDERHAHRFAPGYILDGTDATVYYNSLDFRFTNDTAYPILLSAEVSASRNLTVKILGTKTDDITVKLEKKVLNTTPYEEIEVEDPTIPSGTREVSVTPYTGRTVELYRLLYDADGKLISRTLIDTSVY